MTAASFMPFGNLRYTFEFSNNYIRVKSDYEEHLIFPKKNKIVKQSSFDKHLSTHMITLHNQLTNMFWEYFLQNNQICNDKCDTILVNLNCKKSSCPKLLEKVNSIYDSTQLIRESKTNRLGMVEHQH